MRNSERRQIPRTGIQSLAYISLAPKNSGTVVNISDEGLCFHAVAPVIETGAFDFWFSLEGNRIQATGEVAWTDKSKKTGGLRFIELPAGALEQIRNVTAQPAVAAGSNREFATEKMPAGLSGTRIDPAAHNAAHNESKFTESILGDSTLLIPPLRPVNDRRTREPSERQPIPAATRSVTDAAAAGRSSPSAQPAQFSLPPQQHPPSAVAPFDFSGRGPLYPGYVEGSNGSG